MATRPLFFSWVLKEPRLLKCHTISLHCKSDALRGSGICEDVEPQRMMLQQTWFQVDKQNRGAHGFTSLQDLAAWKLEEFEWKLTAEKTLRTNCVEGFGVLGSGAGRFLVRHCLQGLLSRESIESVLAFRAFRARGFGRDHRLLFSYATNGWSQEYGVQSKGKRCLWILHQALVARTGQCGSCAYP